MSPLFPDKLDSSFSFHNLFGDTPVYGENALCVVSVSSCVFAIFLQLLDFCIFGFLRSFLSSSIFVSRFAWAIAVSVVVVL